MAYVRGYTERGIDYDPKTSTFFLIRPNTDSEKFLDSQFPRTTDGRWQLAKKPTPMRGLGDLIKKGTDLVGIKQCGGCAGRQTLLNKLVPFRREVNP